MKIIFFILFAIDLLPFQSFSQGGGFKKDSVIIHDLEYKWLKSEFTLDTAAISKMMDESFISIGDNSISNKQEELNGMYKNISQRLKNNPLVDSPYLDNFQIKFYGATAIVTYISVTKGW